MIDQNIMITHPLNFNSSMNHLRSSKTLDVDENIPMVINSDLHCIFPVHW